MIDRFSFNLSKFVQLCLNCETRVATVLQSTHLTFLLDIIKENTELPQSANIFLLRLSLENKILTLK